MWCSCLLTLRLTTNLIDICHFMHACCFIKLYSFRTFDTLTNTNTHKFHIYFVFFFFTLNIGNGSHTLSLLPCVYFMCKYIISWIATWIEEKEERNSKKSKWESKRNVVTSYTITWKQCEKWLLRCIDSIWKLLLLSNKHVIAVWVCVQLYDNYTPQILFIVSTMTQRKYEKNKRQKRNRNVSISNY